MKKEIYFSKSQEIKNKIISSKHGSLHQDNKFFFLSRLSLKEGKKYENIRQCFLLIHKYVRIKHYYYN
jgi:hypothetical protein